MSLRSLRLLISSLSTLLLFTPAAAEPSPRDWSAPLQGVTVFSDRARVRRLAKGRLPAGTHEVTLPPLTGIVWMDTVRASAKGAQVIRVERNPAERVRQELPKLKELLEEAEGLLVRINRLQVELQVLDQRRNWLDRLRPAPVVAEQERQGRPPPPIATGAWLASLDTMTGIKTKLDVDRVRLSEEERVLQEAYQAVVTRLQAEDPFNVIVPGVEVQVRLRVAQAGPVQIELEYFVPNASWKPVYDLDFDPKTQKLGVQTAAWVQQNTFEDWSGVELELSTSVPGRQIDLPQPLTWTLGESRDFRFTARAKSRRPTPPPSTAIVTSPREKPIDMTEWQGRLQRVLGQGLGNGAKYNKKTVIDFSDESISGELAKPEGSYLLDRNQGKGRAGRRAPSPAPRPPPRPPGDVMHSLSSKKKMRASSVERDSVGVSTQSTGSSVPSRVRRRMALFGRGAPSKPRFSDRRLPAVTAQGFDFSYKAPGKVVIPSGGEGRRIPLQKSTFAAAVQHEATPSIEATAYLEARVKNERPTPLLAGTTNIFVDGEFVSQGELQTTGPGGTVEFALGADEDIRLERRVMQTTKTTGLISKDDETEYRHIIEVGNYKKTEVVVEVIDQFPKSKNDEVKIDKVSFSPAPAEDGKDDGIVRWRVTLKPGQVTKLELRYRITRPEGWQMYQR